MKQIVLSKEIGSNLVTRSSLDSLFTKINKFKERDVIVNFKDIEFISRSGADEYIKFRDSTKKKITEINQSREIKKMFQMVYKTKDKKIVYNKLEPPPVIII